MHTFNEACTVLSCLPISQSVLSMLSLFIYLFFLWEGGSVLIISNTKNIYSYTFYLFLKIHVWQFICVKIFKKTPVLTGRENKTQAIHYRHFGKFCFRPIIYERSAICSLGCTGHIVSVEESLPRCWEWLHSNKTLFIKTKFASHFFTWRLFDLMSSSCQGNCGQCSQKEILGTG